MKKNFINCYCLNNSGDKENELKEIINMLDIFFSIFSIYISANLSNSLDDYRNIKLLSYIL